MILENRLDCYARSPISYSDGIPVFSTCDFYVSNYDRISADHLEFFEKTGRNPFVQEDCWRETEASTRALISKYVAPHESKILDVGVGMGRLVGPLHEYHRFGVDISLGYLKHARLSGIEVCMSRIEDMPYKEEFFDACITTDVLEHVLDLNNAVTKIFSVLKKDGILIVRVPYKENLSYYLSSLCPHDLGHLRNFDEHSLISLFEKIFGFTVLEWDLSGYRGGPVRLVNNYRYCSALIRRSLRLVEKLSGNAYEFFVKRLKEPSTINMVVKKEKK